MFNEKQLQALGYEIDSSRVKQRSKGNITLSYIEGHDLLDTANRIFGFGNWNYNVSSLEQVSLEINQNQNHVACYKAVVNVTVYDMTHSKQVNREDVGFGTGIAKTLADAHEGGAKEAVTDAIKRAMRSFGKQYGLSLYASSKPQTNNSDMQNYQQPVQMQQTQQQYQQPSQQQTINNAPLDYSSLYNLGLTIMEQGQNLVVIGDGQYDKRDSIKACGFKFDSSSKTWWKPIHQQAA